MARVKTYRIYWMDDECNTHDDYFQALSALDAVHYMGIREDQVIEVAIVYDNWRKH